MNKYRILSLVWILPAYMLFITVQQGLVHRGAIETFNNGDTYLADVTGFEVKQIAAQSNGYVDIEFAKDGEIVERRLTLTVQMAQALMESSTIPLRYKEDSFQKIVLIPTYKLQKSTSLFNLFMALIGLIATMVAAILVQRYSNRKAKDDSAEFTIQRVDQ